MNYSKARETIDMEKLTIDIENIMPQSLYIKDHCQIIEAPYNMNYCGVRERIDLEK